MAAAWRTVRVFISSTFRDMHAERDYLVKVVFPSLRERLEKYRIHLVDIDLRWGITEEEAQRDRVLDLCLEQIDDCRPFFVGILGERYGWVPGSFSEEALSKYGWVQHQTGKSVTELEVLYGVLRDPEMHARALFLFRDPAFIADVPEAKRADMMAENDESAERLRRLKQAIRDAGLPIPLLENYPCRYAGLRINWRLARRELDDAAQEALEGVAADGIVDPGEYGGLDDRLRPMVDRLGVVHLTGLKTFGRYVGEQLWRAIRAEHHLPDVPPVEAGAAADPLAIEQDYHERFMESRLRVYVGRENVQKGFTAFADGDATHPCLVTAPSGSGKSAALAKFATSYAQTHPDVLVIPHFVGASPGSTGLRQMLRRFCLVLKDRFGLAEEVPLDVNELVGRFRGSLESVPGDRRVVLVIDALNQLDETDHAQSMWWLPWELPSGVKIIASSIDDPDRTEPVLQALAHRPVERVPIEPLTDDERREIIRQVPSLSAKTLDERQVDLLLANPATRSPLFLLVALEELRGFGSFGQLEARIAAFPREGDTVAAIFGQVIERLREEFDDNVVRTVLALLACARSGMSERELLEMVEGIGAEESTNDLFPVLRQLGPYLQHRGELLDFFHRGLYKAVRERYLDERSLRCYHQDLAGYFHAKLNPPGTEAWSGEYPRALSELPHHQTEGQLWEPLEATLTALPFLEGKVSAGMVFELAGDFAAAVDPLPDERPQRPIVQLLEEALRRDIHFIARHAEDYPQALFQCLWNTCWWYDCPEAADHCEEPDSGWPPGEPPWVQAGAKLCALLRPWRIDRETGHPGFVWVRSLRPPPIHLGTAQLAVLVGHQGPVLSVAFSPDGQRIASGSQDRTVRVWDVRTGAELMRLQGDQDFVKNVAFSPDGRRIVSGSGGDAVRIWDADTGAELRCVQDPQSDGFIVDGNTANASVAFSPDGRRIVCGCTDDMVHVWDAQSGAELQCFHQKDVTSVVFSPGGRRIASASKDNTVRVWDAQTGAELRCLQGHQKDVTSVVFSPDERRIVSASEDNTVRIWDAQSGAELRCLQGHQEDVTSVAFSANGRWLVSVSGDRTVRVSEAESGAELRCLQGHDHVLSAAFSPDGRWLVGGSRDGTVRVWDLQTGAELRSLQGHQSDVQSVAFSPDGRRIVSRAVEDNTVRVWDAETGAELQCLQGHQDDVQSIAFSHDGRLLATGSWDRTVRVWDARTGAELFCLQGHAEVVTSVVFSPDGRCIACASKDNTVRVWNPETGAELRCLEGHAHAVNSVAFSGDGRRIISGSSDWTARVWDARTGAELRRLHQEDLPRLDQGDEGPFVERHTFSPDGRPVGPVESVTFSPDGRRIVGICSSAVRVWDAQTGAELRCLQGHVGVDSVALSPDGRRIVSRAVEDNSVRVWDAETGECLEVIQGAGDVQAIAAGPPEFPLRAISWRLETVVERADGGQRVAFFPIGLEHIATHPNGRTWTGASGNHLYIITLEGDPSAPPAEPPGRQ